MSQRQLISRKQLNCPALVSASLQPPLPPPLSHTYTDMTDSNSTLTQTRPINKYTQTETTDSDSPTHASLTGYGGGRKMLEN